MTSVSGKATISQGGQNSSRLSAGSIITPGMEIDTSAGGRVVVDLTDGSQVVILPGSRIVFADFRNATSLRELLQILAGRVRITINHLKGQPNPYRVKSPTASIAVRGTRFDVIVGPQGETRVLVLEGEVEVATLQNPSKRLLAVPKRGVVVRPDSTIDYFVPDTFTKSVIERSPHKTLDPKDKRGSDEDYMETATSVYERTIDSIAERGESARPSRFIAFSDPYTDSFGNPAFAATFTNIQGRINLLPSLNGAPNVSDALRETLGLGDSHPGDYSVLPEAELFVPISRIKSVVGGRIGISRSGFNSIAVDTGVLLSSPPFPAGATGVSSDSGSTSNAQADVSLMFATRFGAQDGLASGSASTVCLRAGT